MAPLLQRLFPEVPPDHPAMGAIVMNMASNMLGLGNAATPFGLKAMTELAKLNRNSQTASDAMVLFLAINTSAITILPPTGTIMVRLAAVQVVLIYGLVTLPLASVQVVRVCAMLAVLTLVGSLKV